MKKNISWRYRIQLIVVMVSVFTVNVPTVSAGFIDATQNHHTRAQHKKSDRWLMTYYVGYQYSYLKPKDVDYSLMTHIAVGGVGVRADGTLREHWHMKDGEGMAMAREVGRRAKHAGVKRLIWLGGPNEEELFYSATSDTHRKTFIRNIVQLINTLNYDGVDIDWEPIRAKDEARVLRFVKELRDEAPDMLITMPVNWVPSTVLSSKDMALYGELARYVDKLFIMSYSMAGSWPGWKSWHGGALFGDTWYTPGSVRTSVYAYRKAGVPNSTLGIGIGTYATCWEYPVHEPQQKLPEWFSPKHIGVMSMRTLMDNYYVKKYERWDRTAKVPYLSFRKPHGAWKCGFISYENEHSIAEKMRYVRTHNLGGAMVWNLGTGYYPEKGKRKRHPLLRAAMEALD